MLIRAEVTLADRSLLPRDEFVNTVFAWFNDGVDLDVVGDAFCLQLESLYQSIKNYLSNAVKHTTGSPHTVKLYSAEGLPPHPPLHTHNFNLGAPNDAQDLPNEVALCLSYRAELAPGIKPASNRGRIYLGPFNTLALSAAGVGYEARPEPNLITATLNAAEGAMTGMRGVGVSGLWVVRSPKLKRWSRVVQFRVDNSWDTQRSRGIRPTTVGTREMDLSVGGPPTGTYV